MTDVILAWLCAEDDGARSRIKELMAEKKETLGALRATLNGKPPCAESSLLSKPLEVSLRVTC